MNKKKLNINNYFNVKLFYEAFKQVRIIGFVTLVLFTVIGIFFPIVQLLEDKDTYDLSFEQLAMLDTDAFMCPLLALIFLVTPLMFIMLFSFLTKRSSSDFYHSLPVKRSTMFITFTTAVLTWVVLLSTLYTTIMLIATKFTLPLYIIDESTIISYIINVWVSCLLIIATFTIGISVTGTITSNIIFTSGLLIIPRVVITLLTYLTVDNANTLTEAGHLIFNEYAHMPFALISILFGGGNRGLYNLLLIGEHTFYSLGLAIIYLIIGMKLFVSRPSEVSSKSFRSRKVFLVFRYSFCFLISLIIIGCTFSGDIEKVKRLFSLEFFSIILIVIATIVAAFALEAAYTKSVKKGFKAILSTPLIFLADVVVFFVMYTTVQYYNNETFEKKNVEYIYVTNLFDQYRTLGESEDNYYYEEYYYDEYYYDDEYYLDDSSYIAQMLRNVKITDKYIVDYLVDIYNQDRSPSKSFYHRVKVTFDSSLYDETRYIYMSASELRHIIAKLKENKDVQEFLYNYPTINDNIAVTHQSTTSEQTKALYSSLISEYKNLSFDQLLDIAYNEYSDCIDTLYVAQHVNGHLIYYTLPMLTSTPETLLMSINNENTNNLDDLKNFLNYVENNIDSKDYYLSGDVYFLTGEDNESMYLKSDTNEDILNLIKLLRSNIDSNKEFDKSCLNDKNNYMVRVIFIQTVNDEPKIASSFYITVPVDSPLIEQYEDYTYIEGFELIEIYEDEFGNTIGVYIDEEGNKYEQTINSFYQ